MLEERDIRAPGWAWLRGFAWFLLAWPLLSLLAFDEIDFGDWQAVVAALLAPPAIGLVLLAIERGLTLLFGRRARLRQSVPSTLADISNLGLTLAILLVIDVTLVTVFDDEQIVNGGNPRAARIALLLLAAGCAIALVFRGLHRLIHGPARVVDLGEGWDRAPNTLRLLGYLTLIPMLLVSTVMIDYTLHERSEFGPIAWATLPVLLWLGLRSAMARAPRYWARNPWQAWIRQTSLALPWWTLATATGLGFGVLFLLLPTGLIDSEEMTTAGRITAGVVGIPLGLIVLAGVGLTLVRGLPTMLRECAVARRLARRPELLIGWELKPDQSVVLRLAGGGEIGFDMGEENGAFVGWLAAASDVDVRR